MSYMAHQLVSMCWRVLKIGLLTRARWNVFFSPHLDMWLVHNQDFHLQMSNKYPDPISMCSFQTSSNQDTNHINFHSHVTWTKHLQFSSFHLSLLSIKPSFMFTESCITLLSLPSNSRTQVWSKSWNRKEKVYFWSHDSFSRLICVPHL